MTISAPDTLLQAIEATWPPAERSRNGAFAIRNGAGGGKRVCAATQETDGFEPGDIDTAVAAMRALGQAPLFQVRPGEDALDQTLEARGFTIVDPVTTYLTEPKALADPSLHRLAAIPCSKPLAIQEEIWAAGGIGKPRLDVMTRASDPKTYLLGRHDDRPVGTAFVSIHDGIAMLHAIEVLSESRRMGVGRALMIGAANWALRHEANWLALLVTTANTGANALYASLGMSPVGGYHYRVAPDWTAS